MIAALTSQKILWSTGVQLFGKLFQMALGIVTIKLVTNALGSDEYGVYGKISEFALFFSTAANLGLFGNTVRKMSEAPEDGKLFTNVLILRLFTAGLFLAVGLIYAFFFTEAEFALGVLFFAGALFFDYITSVCDGMLQATYRMGRAVLALVSGRILTFLVVLGLIQLGQSDAHLFFVAPLSGALLTSALSLFFVRQKIKFKWKIEGSLMQMLLHTSLPFGIINILNSLYFRFLPSFFAAKALSDSIFGHYNLLLHLTSAASLLSTFLMFSTLPALKQAIHDKHEKRAKELYKTMRKALIAAGLLLVSLGSLVTPVLIQTLTGKDFFQAGWEFMLPMLLALAAVSYLYDLVLLTLFAYEDELWYLSREFFALGFALIFFFGSLLPMDPHSKMLLILSGALVGESTMVALGFYRLRKRLV